MEFHHVSVLLNECLDGLNIKPGGIYLDSAAQQGKRGTYTLPKPKVNGSEYDFSFSGLKTAVINQAHNLRQQGKEIDAKDWSASFRRCVVDLLVDKTIADCDYTVKIPMSHGVDSLNVAAAGAVAFWTLCRNHASKR